MKNIVFEKEKRKTYHTSLEIIEGIARVRKIDKLNEDDTNSVVLFEDIEMQEGIIEADVLSRLTTDAPAHARGFIGIVFHASAASDFFESFYIRPANGKDCDDPVRKSHGCQYFAYPGYTFSYFREFNISTYEAPVSTIALNEWEHIKAVIKNDQADFFVNDEHVLHVDPLLHQTENTKIGLFVDIGTEGYFKNLSVKNF